MAVGIAAMRHQPGRNFRWNKKSDAHDSNAASADSGGAPYDANAERMRHQSGQNCDIYSAWPTPSYAYDLKYQAAAQGVRRFQQRLAADPARQRFVARMRHGLSAR